MKSLKIKSKVGIAYVCVLLLSLTLTFYILKQIGERYLEREIGNVAMQTLDALDRNLSFIFENVTQFSNLIFFDKNIQSELSQIDKEEIDPIIQQSIQKSLVNMLLSGDYISSVFVLDNFYNNYYSFKVGPLGIDIKAQDADWFEKVNRLNGDILFSANSDGFIKYTSNPDKKFISLLRNIISANNYKKLGTLIINVDEATIQTYFDEVGLKYNSNFSIVDIKGNYIIRPSQFSDEMATVIRPFLNGQKENSTYDIVTFLGKKNIFVQKKLDYADWFIIGLVPINTTNAFDELYMSLFLIIVIINTVFIFFSSIYLTKIIFLPIENLLVYMKKIRSGEFIQIPIEENKNDEISEFKYAFNKMVQAIDKLIIDINAEQKTIRKNELDLIQAQINPHFLYNTLDAVSALALLGENENCLKITQALGDFYRNSLNSALELISISGEIDCIKSYVTILNIRYSNKIILILNIEENILSFKILKLILQPIIENSVYHGLRNREGQGVISIDGYLDEDEIIFIITDNGVGIKENRIEEVLKGVKTNKLGGFGLFSSIQRISMYYGIEKPITIVSEEGSGTEITIRVKVIKYE